MTQLDPEPGAVQGVAGLFYRRLVGASRYSWQGLQSCFRHEEAFRFEVFLGVCLFPLAFVLATSTVELCLLLGSMLVVLIVELLNSAVEATVDLFSAEHHELAGRAKDQGSAAVLLSMILFFVIWSMLAWQYFSA